MKEIILVGTIILLSVAFFFWIYRKRKEKGGLNYIIRLYRLGKFKDCKRNIENYLIAFPNSKNAWLMLGNVSLELNDIKTANKGYFKALKIDENFDKALTGMGVVMRSMQKFNEAEDYYYKALRINPNEHRAKSSLMLLEVYKGNNDVAIALGEDSIKEGLDKVEVGILGNLVIAYHFNDDFVKRDKLFNHLRNIEYKDLFYIMLILDGKIEFKDIMELKHE